MIDACSSHEAPAGWRCEGCAKLLCGECTARAGNIYYCALCDAPATQLVYERTARPFSRWLLGAFAYPVTRGLAIVAITAILLGGAGFTFSAMGPDFAGWSIGVRAAIVGLFVLLVVDSSARGGVAERGVALRLLRALLATLVVWGPAAAYAYFLGAPQKHDWIAYLFAGLAIVYLPIALAVAVTDVSTGAAMNPFAVFELGWVFGGRYVKTLVTVLALGALAGGAFAAILPRLAHITTPLVGDVAIALPALALLAIVLHAIGLLIHVHGAAIGFGSPAMYRDPVLPNEIARARRKDAAVLTTEQLTKMSDTRIRDASVEERADIRKILDFLKGENLARALKLYESRPTWSPGAFEDRQLLALGKAAQRAKTFPLAQRLFEEGIAKEGRALGQLMLAQAQLLGDSLGQSEAARDLFEKIAKNFAGTDAAKIAKQRLGG